MQKPDMTTSGALRKFVLDLLPRVVSGEVDTDVANAVSRLAAQATESLYAEEKAHALGLAPPKLPIGDFSLVSQPHHQGATKDAA